MNHPSIDLSNLPAEIRGRVEMALQKLPPEQRQQFLKHGSPLLNKLVARVAQKTNTHSAKTSSGAGQQGHAAPPPLPGRAAPSPPIHFEREKPHGHYNQTVQPGDRGGFGLFWVVLWAVVAALAWTWLRT